MGKGCLWNSVFVCLVAQVTTVVVVIVIAFRTTAHHRLDQDHLCKSLIYRPTAPLKDQGKPQAFATLVSNEEKYPSGLSYADSALVMLYNLRKLHGDKYKYVAVVTPDISTETIQLFLKLNMTVEVLQKIEMDGKGPARWKDTFTKLWMWGLEEYSKVVYFDADHLILEPMDELFSYPELSAVNQHNGFIAGMFVLVPDTRKMNALFTAMSHSSGCYKELEMDQSFLNWYFRDIYHEIPYEFSAFRMNDSDSRLSGAKAVHGKFFHSDDGCIRCQEIFMQQWNEVANIARG